MVVGSSDEIHPARKKNLGPVGGSAEIEGLGGIHHLVGEGTLQIGEGEIIAVKIPDGVGEGIGIVPVHAHGIVVGALLPQHLVGGEGAVPHEGEGEELRLRLRRRRRGRSGRRRRQGRRGWAGRQLRLEGGDSGRGFIFIFQLGAGHHDDQQNQGKQSEQDGLENFLHRTSYLIINKAYLL